jgi:hypothetical protein
VKICWAYWDEIDVKKMNPIDQNLLEALYEKRIAIDDFLRNADRELRVANLFIFQAIEEAIQAADADALDCALWLVRQAEAPVAFLDTLNALMVSPNHRSHQMIAKTLQDHLPDPKSIPFVRQVLASNFDYLEYTCSESDVITKWLGWLLYAIGTQEAIDVMREYSNSTDPGIAQEMRYRLRKVAAK